MGAKTIKRYKPGPPSEIICPHCLVAFPLWEMNFGGPSTSERYKATRTVKDRMLGHPPRFALGPRGEVLRDKYCPSPSCGGVLPWTAGEQTDLIIGMVGAKYSGKSHYVAALVQRLRREVSRDFEAALIQVDDATAERYRDEFYEPLYGNKLELPATQSGAKPLLYNFTVGGEIWGRGMPNRSVTLAFYDTAGEDFASSAAIDHFVRYLSQASGLIFLIDPLQTQAVRDQIGASVRLPPIHRDGDPQEIMSRVIGALSKHGLASRDRRLNLPVAVVFTKCDVLREKGLIDKFRLWQNDVHHQRCYDGALHDDINGLFSEQIEQWSLAARNTARLWFENHAFFGVSATGCASDERGRFPFISPWRVEDPVLWLLHLLHVIPGCR